MSNEVLFYGLIILLFLLVSAFFSAAETAMTAVTRARLYQLVMSGNKRAQLVSKLRREKESLIGTVLLTNNAVNIAASAIATSLAIRLFGDSQESLALVTLVMTLLVVIFAEILPKTYAIQYAERTSLALSPVISLMVRLLYPITYAIQMIIRATFRLVGVDITKTDTLISTTDIIRGTIELHHREGMMIKQDRDMLGSILDLNDVEVKNIMIHRTKTETINADQPANALINAAVSTMHSRVPLWRGQPDNIVAILHVKDLIKLTGEIGKEPSIEQIMAICHEPWFVPETTNLRNQLLAFRSRQQHLALVVDEYGAWQGIVTLEDIIEEIVGDIHDEHDDVASHIQKIAKNTYAVAGSVTVRDLNRKLDWNLPDENASTVAGLMINQAETIPALGEHLDIHGFRFTVTGKDATQVTELRIDKLTRAEPAPHDT